MVELMVSVNFVINQVTAGSVVQIRKKVSWHDCSKQDNTLQISGKCPRRKLHS